MKNYETEARERWGNTDAYREHEQKTKNRHAENCEEKTKTAEIAGFLRRNLL